MLRLNLNLLKMENERKYYTIDQYGNEVREMTDEEVTQHLYEMQARIDEEWHITLGGRHAPHHHTFLQKASWPHFF